MSLSSITEKRIKNELKNLKKIKIDNIQVIQDENDKFVFYFLLKGIKKSDYEGGYYIGKIMLQNDYPKSPVDYQMLTPSGRFMINQSICLTNSKYHKEQWSPSWNLENMTVGFISIFNDDTEHGISHIKEKPEVRRQYAHESIAYNLTHFPHIFKSFDQFVNYDGTVKSDDELKKNKEDFNVEKLKKKQTNDNACECTDKNLSLDALLGKEPIEVKVNDKVNDKVNTKMDVNNCKEKKVSSLELIKANIELLKKMTYDTFDINLCIETNKLMTNSLSEL